MTVERTVKSTTCLTPFASCCLRIAHSVNVGENIFAWKMRSRHEFVPLLVEKKDWSFRFVLVRNDFEFLSERGR